MLGSVIINIRTQNINSNVNENVVGNHRTSCCNYRYKFTLGQTLMHAGNAHTPARRIWEIQTHGVPTVSEHACVRTHGHMHRNSVPVRPACRVNQLNGCAVSPNGFSDML